MNQEEKETAIHIQKLELASGWAKYFLEELDRMVEGSE